MDGREIIERNQEALIAGSVATYRDMLLRWLRAYGNTNRLGRDQYEAELFRVFLATASMLRIEPEPPHVPPRSGGRR